VAPTFAAVYAEYAPTVARWAARLGGPQADVEDITQEVFVVVNRGLAEFRGDSRLSTWLFGITARVAANERRRRKLRQWWFRLAPNLGERGPATADGALEQLETRERRALFHRALDRIGERQRRALILFELEEMSVDEVAAHMGLRPGNVRVLLHRARAAFLKSMIACELDEALAASGPPPTRAEGERR
jgi:RNA polymerase sigma-70 factor (ECF subfamily)